MGETSIAESANSTKLSYSNWSNPECVAILEKAVRMSSDNILANNTNEFSLFTLSYSCEMTTINTWTITGLNIY